MRAALWLLLIAAWPAWSGECAAERMEIKPLILGGEVRMVTHAGELKTINHVSSVVLSGGWVIVNRTTGHILFPREDIATIQMENP